MTRTRFSAAAGLVAAGGLAIPLALAGTASATGTTWVATATAATPTTGLTPLGAVAASTPVHVQVAVALRDPAGLKSLVAAGGRVTPAEFAATYAPTPATIDAVETYLRSAGLTAVTSSSDGLLVSATGTASAVAAAFHTTLAGFSQGGRSVFANTSAAMVPSTLAGDVVAVLGLNTIDAIGTRPASAPSSCLVSGLSVGYPCSYEPQGFWQAYDASSAPTGSGTAIGILAEGDLSGVVTDLRTEEAYNGLPQVPVQVVATGPASSDTSGSDEWDLDTQYSTGMAGTVSNLVLYDAPSLSNSDLTTEIDSFVTGGQVQAASASFGECEAFAALDGSMAADDQILAEGAALGRSLFASSGDTGGFCPVGAAVNGVPAGAPDVNFPASSPYVTAVGGTTLVTNGSGGYSNEVAWYSGGGGPSYFESAGSWQTGGTAGAGGVRTVPDVAMDADPNSGADVVVAGSHQTIGGTSLSAPLALGVWARLESSAGNGLGFAPPKLYGAAGTAAYHDIVAGAALPYPALPGYDLATGEGTFDVAKAVSTIG